MCLLWELSILLYTKNLSSRKKDISWVKRVPELRAGRKGHNQNKNRVSPICLRQLVAVRCVLGKYDRKVSTIV